MKQQRFSIRAWAGIIFAALSMGVHAAKQSGSPLQKVITLMTQLQGQVIGEGEMAQSTYKKYSGWCDKTSKEKQFEISESKDLIEDLKAAIDKSKSDGEEAQARVEELSGSLATDAQDVKAITLIRDKEKAEFEAMDQELTATVETISKARSVLKKELDKAGLKAGASFLQKPTKGMQLFAAALDALVTTSLGVSADSRAKLSALMQMPDSKNVDEDKEDEDVDKAIDEQAAKDEELAKQSPVFLQEDSEENADPPAIAKPETPVYEAKSGSILEVLEKMEEEAQSSQAKERKKEQTEKFNYELLKQRLNDRINTQTKELETAKKDLAAAKETGATSKGKLDMVTRDLEEDKKFLKKLQQGCMERASEFEMEMKTRGDELTALAAAKKTVQSIAFTQVPGKASAVQTDDSDSDDESEGAVSFAQVDMGVNSEAHQRNFAILNAGAAVANKLKQLATDEHSVALAQLSSRVSRVLHRMKTKGLSSAEARADPFKKIKNLIANMIEKLEGTQAEEARQKAFCDKEMAETEASKKDRSGTIESLSTKIEEGVAEVEKLNQQKTMLLGEIKDIASSQGEMDELRQSEHDGYKKVSKELKEGLAAVQTALSVLRDFYSQAKDDESAEFIQDMGSSMKDAAASASVYQGAGGGTAIIGLLEVCESDFSKGLAEGDAEEDAALGEYTKLTQENKKERAVKDKTVTNIGSDVARIEKKMAEFTGDRTETQQELDALLEYLGKLTKQCVAQPDSYKERAERRKREIDGLEQALASLAGQEE